MTAAIRAARAVPRWSSGRRRRLSLALGEVARWNRRLDAGNRRATLVKIWMELTFRLRPGLEDRFNRAETVPDAIAARVAGAAARALLDAVARWRAAGRPAWGEVHRLAIGETRLPVGGSSHVNRAAGWLTRPDVDSETLDFPVEVGSTCVIAVRLTPDRARARFLKVTGPVEDPASPLHVLNAADWAAGRFRRLELD
jgi:acyl-homoserine lactone acylase PvdQ